jgi:hypothetical protein
MSKKPLRQIRERAERDLNDAIRDRNFWAKQEVLATHPIAKRTYQRGVLNAEARITEARNKLGR